MREGEREGGEKERERGGGREIGRESERERERNRERVLNILGWGGTHKGVGKHTRATDKLKDRKKNNYQNIQTGREWEKMCEDRREVMMGTKTFTLVGAKKRKPVSLM